MSDKFRYLSKQWQDEAEKQLRSVLTPQKMNHITSSMSNIYRNCPGGKDLFLFISLIDGEFDKCLAGEGTPPEAEFIITGDYSVFAQISRAELSSQLALMTGKLKLKGNMVKALKLASISDRINKVFSTIPTEY